MKEFIELAQDDSRKWGWALWGEAPEPVAFSFESFDTREQATANARAIGRKLAGLPVVVSQDEEPASIPIQDHGHDLPDDAA